MSVDAKAWRGVPGGRPVRPVVVALAPMPGDIVFVGAAAVHVGRSGRGWVEYWTLRPGRFCSIGVQTRDGWFWMIMKWIVYGEWPGELSGWEWRRDVKRGRVRWVVADGSDALGLWGVS